MRTFKKTLALVVVLALSLGMVANAGAMMIDDSTLEYNNTEAIALLGGLGVLTGDEGGFRPEATITRAEACAVIYRMLTGNTYANNYAGATDFSDVAGSHWASGYINYCTAFGVVNGYPDGAFLPDAPVTFGEMVTMIVRALGCDKDDDGDSLNLTFPAGYMGVADQQGVLDSNMTLGADAPAPRGLVAQLACNAILNAQYKRAGYYVGKGGNYYWTIAEKVFDMEDDTGVVLAYGDYNFGMLQEELDSDEVYIYHYGDDYGYGNIYECSSIDITKYLYREVKFWNDGDEVFAMTLTDGNTEVTANAEDVSLSDGDIEVDGTEYANDVDMGTVNFDPQLTYLLEGWSAAFDQNVAVSYTFISNDGDADSFEAVIMKVYALADIELIDEDTMLYDSVQTGAGNFIGFYNLATDGLEADLGEVTFSNYEPEEGDTVMFIYYPLANGGDVDDENGDFEMYELDEVSGKFTSYSSTTSAYTIGGSKYYALADDDSMADISVNTAVEATQLPMFGYIYDAAEPDDADSETANIYLVTKMGSEASGRYGTETTYYLTAWNSDGEEVEFEVDADAAVYYSAEDSAVFTDATYSGDGDSMRYLETAYDPEGANVDFYDEFLAAYYDGSGLELYLAYLGFDDGVIDEITPVDYAFGSDYDYEETIVKYSSASGLLYLNDDSTPVNTYKTLIESDSVSFFWNDDDEEATVYYGTFPSDAENYCVVRYYDDASYDPMVAALFDGEPTGDSDSDTDTYFGILLDGTVYGNPDDDDESYIEYTIATDGKIATYSTEMGDNDMIAGLYDNTAYVTDGTPHYASTVMYFKINNDGEIVLMGEGDYLDTFKNAYIYNEAADEYIVDMDTIDSIGNGLIDLDGAEYEIAADVNVYVTKGSASDWDETTIGTLSSVKASSSSYYRTAVIILSEDMNGDDWADAEVIDIFFFQDDAVR